MSLNLHLNWEFLKYFKKRGLGSPCDLMVVSFAQSICALDFKISGGARFFIVSWTFFHLHKNTGRGQEPYLIFDIFRRLMPLFSA